MNLQMRYILFIRSLKANRRREQTLEANGKERRREDTETMGARNLSSYLETLIFSRNRERPDCIISVLYHVYTRKY